MLKQIANNVTFIGIEDSTLDLFEGLYKVPNGVTYNSVVFTDEKAAIMDTADKRVSDEWMTLVKKALKDRNPDYLIISHMEPDHSANIENILREYPNIKIVGNAKTFQMLPNFITIAVPQEKKVEVKDGDVLDLGEHKLKFIMAPMVHWPEVMMSYDETDKLLFTADAFGRFGKFVTDLDWVDEARRYYFNIVGKYGAQVQKILKAVAPVEVKKIIPLHGPVLESNLTYYRNRLNIWSSYEPEDKGVTIACASIHGNTREYARLLKEELVSMGAKVSLFDLSRCDISEAVESAFRFNKLILMSSTYDADLYPPMKAFLNRLLAKNYQNRGIAFIENGSWAPAAAKKMQEYTDKMANITYYDKTITIKTTVKQSNIEEMTDLINWAKE